MLRKLVLLALFSTAVVVGVGLHGRGVFSQSSAEPGTLQAIAEEAQTNGETEVYLDVNVQFEGVNDLGTAISNYTIIEATPLDKRSYILDALNIGTWYKFRIDSTISQKPWHQCFECDPAPDPPGDMLPLNANEILVLHPAGTNVINGVSFFTGVPNFPDFTLNQKYLLFINLDLTKQVGLISVGPPGVYTVDYYGKLAPIFTPENIDGNPIGQGLSNQYGNNVNNLRNALNPPPPPPTCDPYEEQSCWDRGGTWDIYICYCNEPPQCGGYMWNCY